MSLLRRVLRSGEGRKLRDLQALVPDINALEKETQRLDDDGLRARTGEFRGRLDRGESTDELLLEAFAVVREASVRVLGQRHFDVQLVGGAALHWGAVAEMRTGEGKTLTSTLPVYLTGLTGRGVHVVTVNDYLAGRDAEWMGRLYKWLGLSVGLIVPGNRGWEHKRRQYACDVTYGTNNELGFDYLRDNMAMSRAEQVQRGHHYCIVDEIDSILIDEARTPLIISGQVADAAKLYTRFAGIARGLQRDVHYEVDEEKRSVAPLEEGVHAVERMLGVENLYDMVAQNLVHQLQAALRAKELYRRDHEYIVQHNQVKIVDEFTGRVLEGRRWSDGLHQAVEAKEGVAIKEENQTLATITLQNYYRMYERLAGMTGTAETEASEFASTYGLHVVSVPTHRPMIRGDRADLIYKTEDAKFAACAEDILERNERGQPVLVGTVSVEKSEKLSRLLDKQGIAHEVLNAKQHHREAEIVTQAGRLGAVTVATNMAGRGVDILLGGNPEGLARRDLRAETLEEATPEGAQRLAELTAKHGAATDAEREEVLELGGLYVLGTERHESRRIDNQLRGRSGRQGDPGESRFYLSLEDELMSRFATGAMNWVMDKALPEDVPIEAGMVTKAIERAQNTVEQRNAETRKNVLKYDEVMNEQRKVIYQRRSQILDGTDLRSEALEHLEAAVVSAIATHCESEHPEEWDREGLGTELAGLWPGGVEADRLDAVVTHDEMSEVVNQAALDHYGEREEQLSADVMRQVERQVMLRLIDQRWRSHLREMDLLREGIHLRAMGQKDPATEWQREGFEMFGQMMDGIALDFVRYVMHVQLAEQAPEDAPRLVGVTASKSEAASPALAGVGAAAPQPAAAAAASSDTARAAVPNQPPNRVPVVKSELEKVGRNQPCPCGSGKKYKMCHGRPGAG
ncbi:MAG: preprotein translocase subunit SecA [Acidimicrobiaceae bacterium]|nr:preprotein translocase subunit SecA [Acidimicrobiaceae bacterium]MYH92292.1 preprotein translocase subunit SecA [Acidimicrobiaceae bacterium]